MGCDTEVNGIALGRRTDTVILSNESKGVHAQIQVGEQMSWKQLTEILFQLPQFPQRNWEKVHQWKVQWAEGIIIQV